MTSRDRDKQSGKAAPRITAKEVESLLGGLGRRLEARDLALDDNGFVWLNLGRELEVSLFFAPHLGAFIASTPLVEAKALSLPMLGRLAHHSLDWTAMGGGIFSIPPESPYLTFSTLIPLTPGDVDALDRALAAFGCAVIELQRFVEAFGLEAPASRPGIDEVHIAS